MNRGKLIYFESNTNSLYRRLRGTNPRGTYSAGTGQS